MTSYRGWMKGRSGHQVMINAISITATRKAVSLQERAKNEAKKKKEMNALKETKVPAVRGNVGEPGLKKKTGGDPVKNRELKPTGICQKKVREVAKKKRNEGGLWPVDMKVKAWKPTEKIPKDETVWEENSSEGDRKNDLPSARSLRRLIIGERRKRGGGQRIGLISSGQNVEDGHTRGRRGLLWLLSADKKGKTAGKIKVIERGLLGGSGGIQSPTTTSPHREKEERAGESTYRKKNLERRKKGDGFLPPPPKQPPPNQPPTQNKPPTKKTHPKHHPPPNPPPRPKTPPPHPNPPPPPQPPKEPRRRIKNHQKTKNAERQPPDTTKPTPQNQRWF